MSEQEGLGFHIDNEWHTITNIEINNMPGLRLDSTTGGTNMVLWVDAENRYFFLLSGQIETDVLVAVAESVRSEEHTSELQSHRFISYAVFCLGEQFAPGGRMPTCLFSSLPERNVTAASRRKVSAYFSDREEKSHTDGCLHRAGCHPSVCFCDGDKCSGTGMGTPLVDGMEPDPCFIYRYGVREI